MTATYEGRCFCGTVRVEVRGEPEAMGYCHCASCREWSAGPVNAFALWTSDKVAVTAGEEALESFRKTESSDRAWCTRCGGHVFTVHPPLGLTDVYPAILDGLEFRPAIHVHYQETVLPMRDGLPKQRDVPADLGGSGELIAE